MLNQTQREAANITFERSYEASVEELWELWTTKEGLEDWWGPEGFRVEVRSLDLKVGGQLFYAMIASAPEQVEAMRRLEMPLSHAVKGTITEIVLHERLVINHIIDFIPGVEPYENQVSVEFFPQGAMVRMLITVEPHKDPRWTADASHGWKSQLTKLPGALSRRRSSHR